MKSKEEYTKIAHEFIVYEESEQSDLESNNFDDLWQSIYDVLQLATYGILEFEEDEIKEAMDWLKETKPLVEKYKDVEIYF